MSGRSRVKFRHIRKQLIELGIYWVPDKEKLVRNITPYGLRSELKPGNSCSFLQRAGLYPRRMNSKSSVPSVTGQRIASG